MELSEKELLEFKKIRSIKTTNKKILHTDKNSVKEIKIKQPGEDILWL